MRTEIPFCGPSQEGRVSLAGAQKSVNLYPVLRKPGDKNKVSLYSSPGLKALVSIGPGPCRSNGTEFKDKLYFVSGASLISIDSDNAGTVEGTLSTADPRAELAAGRDYLALVDGLYGYTWDGTTFARITDADFPINPTHISYLDGYFIVNKGDTDEFYISAIEDPTSWAALDFANAEASPDDILALTVNEKDLFLLGSRTSQGYYNSGNIDFPFEPYPNGVIQIGIQAPHSLVSDEEGVFWLATSKKGGVKIVRFQGSQYADLSTSDINWQINAFDITNDAVAWLEHEGGRTYYVITFPSADKTFCCDLNLPTDVAWFEKKSRNIGRWRISGYGGLGKKGIVGDYTNNQFYELDFNTFDEDGDELERIRRCQIIHNDNLGMIIHALELDVEVGVGLTTGQGSDPQIMFRYSNDGNKTFSNEIWQSLGAIGNYTTEVHWRKLGDGDLWFLEVKVTDPVKFNILGAYADIETLDV